MIRRGAVLAGLLVAAGAAPLRAQEGTGLDPQCAGGALLMQDACQQAADLFRFLAPQLGGVVASGNALLGDAATLGGRGRWAMELRINSMLGGLPAVDALAPDTGRAQRHRIPIVDQPVALPLASGAIGIERGVVTAGGSRVGGLDLLVGASFLPSLDAAGLSLDAGRIALAYGLRLGIVEGVLGSPSLVATWLHRDLPGLSIVGTSGDSRVEVRDVAVRTDAWRLVGGTSLGPLRLAGGLGLERYASRADVFVSLGESDCDAGTACSGSPFPDGFAQTLVRRAYFVDASLPVGGTMLVLELGRVSGGRVESYNEFVGQQPGAARWTAALGVRYQR
jgi:hypothetical protein